MFPVSNVSIVDTSRLDTVAQSIFYSTGIPAILCNIILLYLIFRKSPPSLRVYRILLANTAIADLIFSLSVTLAQIRIIPVKGFFTYIGLGPISYLGPNAVYEAYTVQLHSIFYTFLSFPLSFGFRYWVLSHPMPRQRTLIAICLGLCAVTSTQHFLFHISQEPNNDKVITVLKKFRPQYDLSQFEVCGNYDMFEYVRVMAVLFTITLPMFPIYIIIVLLYKKTKGFLRENNLSFRETTIRRHTRLLNALVVQASVPLFTIFPPIIIYFLYHIEIITSPWAEYCVYPWFSFYPLFCPLVTIVYVRPYYNAVIRVVTRRNPFWNSTKYRRTASCGESSMEGLPLHPMQNIQHTLL